MALSPGLAKYLRFSYPNKKYFSWCYRPIRGNAERGGRHRLLRFIFGMLPLFALEPLPDPSRQCFLLDTAVSQSEPSCHHLGIVGRELVAVQLKK
jgi:hypothetical protein